MSGLAAYQPRLEASLREIAGAHGVPGAVCGVFLGGETAVATAGLANRSTGVEVSPDTLFQIGSITKLYTTTLTLQAASAGVLALDEPVRAQLQEFCVADPGATLEITPRHLLSHTSGIAGDHLLDTGANADALKLYTSTLPGLGQVHAPDEAYSFCNTGFGVAGRLIEEVSGGDYDQILRRRLARPLGCSATLTLPQHLLLRRVAAGHNQAPGGAATTQARWTLTRSNGPMGGIVCTAGDLLAFARMHLDGGLAADGSEILPPAAAEQMREPHVETPIPGEEQALGWTRRRWGDLLCLAQDADTFGQRAFLRLVPERQCAVCVLANSPLGGALCRDLLPRLVGDLLDVDISAVPQDGDPPVTAPSASPPREPYIGTYTRLHQRVVVAEAPDGGLVLTTEPSGVLAALGARRSAAPLRPLQAGDGAFAMVDTATGVDQVVVFDADHGVAAGLHLAGRLHVRAS